MCRVSHNSLMRVFNTAQAPLGEIVRGAPTPPGLPQARAYNWPTEFKYSYKDIIKSTLLFNILNKLLFDEVREKDNLVYSIGASKNFNQKVPIELISFYTYFNSDPKNTDIIKDKIDTVIESIKNKDFDLKIFKDQKLALKNNYKTSIETNGFWLWLLSDAKKSNLNFERIAHREAILNSITINDIVKLANKYFDENYFRSVSFVAE